jgi:hypothetical protein
MRFSRGSFRHWRAAVVMATCFTDFLRFSKVLNVRLEDITLAGNNLHFRVKKAKNHRLGFNVCLPMDDPKSIGAFVLDFLQLGLKWRPGKVGFLCCQLEGGNFRTRLPISYSALHSSCKDLIEAVGLDPTKYSTHSAKRGSATAAVVAGCADAEVTALADGSRQRPERVTSTGVKHSGKDTVPVFLCNFIYRRLWCLAGSTRQYDC